MKDARYSSPTYTESLFLHVFKHNLLFFFYLAFLSRIFTIHRTPGEGGGYLFISFLPIPPASQTLVELLLQRAHLCVQLAAGVEHGTFGTRALEFTLSLLAPVAGVVRGMLKIRVTLKNISRFLLNLTKRLLFAIFKDSCLLPMFTQLTVIFYLSFINYGCFSP